MSNHSTDISPVRYRVVVASVGIVFGGQDFAEALRQFRFFAIHSEGKPVVLFKNFDVIRDYRPRRM